MKIVDGIRTVNGLPEGLYLKQLRIEALAKGLCYECRCRPIKSIGIKRCVECLARVHERRRRRIRNRPRGECSLCTRPNLRGLTVCAHHKQQKSTSQKRNLNKRKARGQCVRCNEQARPGKTMCEQCAAAWVAELMRRGDARVADGRCFHCGHKRQIETIKLCNRCTRLSRIYQQRSAQRRKEARAA